MEREPPPWTLGSIATALGGELAGPSGMEILRPVPADSDDPAGICFAESERYLAVAEASAVGAVITMPELRPKEKPSILVADPKLSFARLLQLAERPMPVHQGIHPTAVVHGAAKIDESAAVGPYVVIERGARIGRGCALHPFVYVGEDCVLEEDCTLYPHAVLYRNVRLGKRTIVHAGAVLGADGFGYTWDGATRQKVPQIGGVDIGEDCEIGALTAVDRGTVGDTRVGRGTKLDNLVQVGHNTRIGDHGAIASQTGISGSTTIGDRVVMGGQSATSHGTRVASDTIFGGRSGVAQDVDEPGTYFGLPARPIGEAMRALMLATRLPELFARVRKLERERQPPE